MTTDRQNVFWGKEDRLSSFPQHTYCSYQQTSDKDKVHRYISLRQSSAWSITEHVNTCFTVFPRNHFDFIQAKSMPDDWTKVSIALKYAKTKTQHEDKLQVCSAINQNV